MHVDPAFQSIEHRVVDRTVFDLYRSQNCNPRWIRLSSRSKINPPIIIVRRIRQAFQRFSSLLSIRLGQRVDSIRSWGLQ